MRSLASHRPRKNVPCTSRASPPVAHTHAKSRDSGHGKRRAHMPSADTDPPVSRAASNINEPRGTQQFATNRSLEHRRRSADARQLLATRRVSLDDFNHTGVLAQQLGSRTACATRSAERIGRLPAQLARHLHAVCGTGRHAGAQTDHQDRRRSQSHATRPRPAARRPAA